MSDGKIMQISDLTVGRDLSGGVRIALGGREFVLAPQEAIKFAGGVLKAAGCNVEFSNPVSPVIRPRLVS